MTELEQEKASFKHEMQHPDSPTWCIHCGTFDVYCEDMPCDRGTPAKFDSRIPGAKSRMIKELFGDDEEARKWTAPRKLEHL